MENQSGKESTGLTGTCTGTITAAAVNTQNRIVGDDFMREILLIQPTPRTSTGVLNTSASTTTEGVQDGYDD